MAGESPQMMAGVRLTKTERTNFKKKLKEISKERDIKLSISDFYRKCTLALSDDTTSKQILELIKL